MIIQLLLHPANLLKSKHDKTGTNSVYNSGYLAG